MAGPNGDLRLALESQRLSYFVMSAALTSKEARIIAHAFHKFKDQKRKKYRLMNKYCMFHGLCNRSSDQLKYLVETRAITKEAICAKDTGDSDVENNINNERIAAACSTKVVKVEKGKAGAANAAEFNNQAHRRRCRELLTEQNLPTSSPLQGASKYEYVVSIFSFCSDSFSHRIAEGAGRKRPLLKAKSALQGLLAKED